MRQWRYYLLLPVGRMRKPTSRVKKRREKVCRLAVAVNKRSLNICGNNRAKKNKEKHEKKSDKSACREDLTKREKEKKERKKANIRRTEVRISQPAIMERY